MLGFVYWGLLLVLVGSFLFLGRGWELVDGRGTIVVFCVVVYL